MHIETLPADSPLAPLVHAVVDNASDIQAAFRHEARADRWNDMASIDFDPAADRHADADPDWQLQTLPADSPYAPLVFALLDEAGDIDASFRHERDRELFVDMETAPGMVLGVNAIAELDLS